MGGFTNIVTKWLLQRPTSGEDMVEGPGRIIQVEEAIFYRV
jgi:hypothetical protein